MGGQGLIGRVLGWMGWRAGHMAWRGVRLISILGCVYASFFHLGEAGIALPCPSIHNAHHSNPPISALDGGASGPEGSEAEDLARSAAEALRRAPPLTCLDELCSWEEVRAAWDVRIIET